MRKTGLLFHLEDFCKRLSIIVKYDRFFGRGGFCKLRDKSYFIINERLSNEAKEQIFIDELKSSKFTAVPLPRKLKDLLPSK